MTLSEAVEVAGQLIDCYPNGGGNAGDRYIGALAAILRSFPRLVAERAADPLHGVPRETKFLPTAADVIAWCEPETNKLRASLNYENTWVDRAEQARLRAEREREEIEDRKQRPTMEELRAKYGPTWGLKSIDTQRKDRTIDSRRLFDRAAARAGHDAGSGIVISPYLVAAIRGPAEPSQDERN